MTTVPSSRLRALPVVEFLFDAGIAVMVFPLEWMLRKMILGGGLKATGTTATTEL